MIPRLADTPVLETARLTLRAPLASDWPAFNAFLASPRAAVIRSGAYDEALTWRAFGHFIGHWVLRGFGNFVMTLTDGGRALGMVGPWFPLGWPEPEIGWSIWEADAEGKGYAREAAMAARHHVFHDLGWQTAVSYIATGNSRSILLAERLGAALEPGAPTPFPDKPMLVYRHPRPETGR